MFYTIPNSIWQKVIIESFTFLSAVPESATCRAPMAKQMKDMDSGGARWCSCSSKVDVSARFRDCYGRSSFFATAWFNHRFASIFFNWSATVPASCHSTEKSHKNQRILMRLSKNCCENFGKEGEKIEILVSLIFLLDAKWLTHLISVMDLIYISST